MQLTHGRDSPNERFDIFDASGSWLGELRAPAAVRGYGTVFGDSDVVAAIDGEDGRPMVVRYRIDRGRWSGSR